MDNENAKLDALTNQLVTISLGGKPYKARRATLYDVGVMNKKRAEIEASGDTGNIDMDTTFFVLYQLIKDQHPEITSPDDLAKAIPFEYYQDVMTAFEQVGFRVPQPQTETKGETGA